MKSQEPSRPVNADNQKKQRNLEFSKLDRVQFEGMLEEQTTAIESCLCDMAIAFGAIVGHSKVAAALRARINEADLGRPSTTERLLDAIWRAASRHAERGSPSRG